MTTRPEGSLLPALPSDLTPAEVEQGIALIRPDEEWDGVSDGDITPDITPQFIPELKKNFKKAGGFTLDDGDIVQEVEVVLLAKQNTRAWFEKKYNAKDSAALPACFSSDAVTPDDRSVKKQAATCAECPKSQWGSDPDPERDTPWCRESFSAWVFMPDPLGFGRFARIRFGGLAFAPFRNYWRSSNLRLPKRPPIAYLTRITLEETPVGSDIFLVPRFLRTRDLARSEAQPLIVERDKRMSEFKAMAAEDATKHTDDEPAAGPFDNPPPTGYRAEGTDDGEPF